MSTSTSTTTGGSTPTPLTPEEVQQKLSSTPLGTKISLTGFTPVGEFTDTGFLTLHEGDLYLARDKKGTQLIKIGQNDIQYTDITVRDSSMAPTDRVRGFARQPQRPQPGAEPAPQREQQVPPRQPSEPEGLPTQQQAAGHQHPPSRPSQESSGAAEASQLRALIQILLDRQTQPEPARQPQADMPTEVLTRLATALTGPKGGTVLAEEAGSPTLTVVPFRPLLRPFALWTYGDNTVAWRTDLLAAKTELGIHLVVPHGLPPDAAKKAHAAVEANHAALRFAERNAADQLVLFARSPLSPASTKDEWYPIISAGVGLMAALATARRTFIEGGGKVLSSFEDQWFTGELNLGALHAIGFR